MKPIETHKDGTLILDLPDASSWHAWLADNFNTVPSVWLKFAKKASGVTTVSYAEALDEALCYGWIDSLVNRYDDTYYIQKFSPRKKRSNWSSTNRESVRRLTESGRMQPSGEAAVDEAQADGRWNA